MKISLAQWTAFKAHYPREVDARARLRMHTRGHCLLAGARLSPADPFNLVAELRGRGLVVDARRVLDKIRERRLRGTK